jgi:hypothetical protein
MALQPMFYKAAREEPFTRDLGRRESLIGNKGVNHLFVDLEKFRNLFCAEKWFRFFHG